MLSVLNYIAFNLTMFRLKTIQVYMDEENVQEADVKRELQRLKVIRFAFATTCVILLLGGPI